MPTPSASADIAAALEATATKLSGTATAVAAYPAAVMGPSGASPRIENITKCILEACKPPGGLESAPGSSSLATSVTILLQNDGDAKLFAAHLARSVDDKCFLKEIKDAAQRV